MGKVSQNFASYGVLNVDLFLYLKRNHDYVF